MALQDKIYAYFDRDPKLHILFVFDAEMFSDLTKELDAIVWRPGYRLVKFDGKSWLGIKLALENDWKDEKVILVINGVAPHDTEACKGFPLMGLLAANAEYRAEGYEQFMQHNGIPAEYAELAKAHVEEFDREKYAKILRPYFNADGFKTDTVMRGLISGYMGETKLLSWDDIVIRMIIGDVEEGSKKAEQLYKHLHGKRDVLACLQNYLTGIFGFGFNQNVVAGRMEQIVESMKYNSIAQKLPLADVDNYRQLRICDSRKLERLNRLLESVSSLPKQRREAFMAAFDRLSSDIRETEILNVYGVDADYYRMSPAMADVIIRSIAENSLTSAPDKSMARLLQLRAKVEDARILAAIEYATTVAQFYDKLSRIGSVVYDTPNEYIQRYTADLYLFDTYYRQSIQQYHHIDNNLDCFAPLETVKGRLDIDYAKLENKINSEWVRCLKEKGNGYGEISKDVVRQKNWFKSFYDPNIKQAVIICDAFRFEMAKQLIEYFAVKKRRYIPDLKPGLAMLPTETKYCKSALLPHENLELMDLTLAVDNRILNDSDARESQLQSKVRDAKFVDFDTVHHGSRSTIRPLFTGGKLRMLFYDEIDHVGHGSTPRKVVNACATAIEELEKVITNIFDIGNVMHVYITSDHGFLYNDMTFEDKDKLDVDDSDIEKKSRYYLTTSGTDVPGITKFPLDNVSDMGACIYVAVPDGTNRIKVRGGDYNFAHGGASLQEVIIPVLHVYAPENNKKVPTGVTLLGRNYSIVSSRLKVQLFQDEAVSGAIKERTVSIAIYNGNTMVSNEKIVTLASTNSDQVQARIYDVDLTLLKTGNGLLQLRIYDVDDRLNPLQTVTVTDNTLITPDF